ncbi:MAG: ABC transporter substrate-binding protein [Jiangellales bacterium]
MRGLTRAGWVAGAAALSLALAACGSDDAEPAETEAPEAAGGAAEGSVTINGCDPENPFIPSNTNETCGGTPLDEMFTGLVSYSADTAAPYNAVAQEFATEDNQTWTITLNEDYTFHDGTPVTAQSFVDAWNWASYGPNAQLNSYFFGPDAASIEGFADVQGEDANGDEVITEDEAPVTEMSGLTAVDDYTLEVVLERPFSIFPTVVGYTAFSPLPESFFDDPEAFGQAPIGNGPFEFVSYSPQEEIVLTAYEDYVGVDKPTIKDATFRVYNDIDSAYADLLANNLDILDDIPVSALAGEQFKADLGDRQVVQPQGVIQTISVPLKDADGNPTAFDNPDLRLAISRAIDREAITQAIFEGTATPADSYVSPVVDGYVEGACGDACVFDEAAAQAALEAAGGYDETLTLAYNADGDHKAWTEAACNSINSALGIECVATPVVDFSTFREQINAREQTGMFRTGWQMDYPNIENFLAPLYTTTAGSNDGDYSNAEFDALINEAAAAESIDQANALYQEAEQVLVGDLPVFPLWYPQTVGGWSENVSDATFNAFGRIDLPSLRLAG